MNRFYNFMYKIGYAMAYVTDFITPKMNWVIPFAAGMIVYHFL